VEDGHRVYELYTSATGFYICLLIARAIAMFAGWLRQVKRAIHTVCRMAQFKWIGPLTCSPTVGSAP